MPSHPRLRALLYGTPRWVPGRYADHYARYSLNAAVAVAKALSIDVFLPTYYTTAPFAGPQTVAFAYDLIDHEYPLFSPNGAGFVERQRRAIAGANHVVAISRSTARLVETVFDVPGHMISIAHLAASDLFVPRSVEDGAAFRAKHTRGNRFFLFVGATEQYKNLGVLFRAFAISRARKDHVLLLAGHSVNRIGAHLQQLAVELGIERLICLAPLLKDEELALAYSAATAFVFPSLQEGFGIPLVEAMRCRATIIASDIPVFREVCADDVTYFEPHDVTALTEKMDVAASGFGPKSYSLDANYSWNKTAAVLFTACCAVMQKAQKA